MTILEAIQKVIASLNGVSVQGAQNLNLLLGSIQVLNGIVDTLQKGETQHANPDDEKRTGD